MKQMKEGKENVDLVYSSTLLFIFKERIQTGIQANNNPDAGVDTEVMEEYSILACFQLLAKPVFLYKPDTKLTTVDLTFHDQFVIKKLPFNWILWRLLLNLGSLLSDNWFVCNVHQRQAKIGGYK